MVFCSCFARVGGGALEEGETAAGLRSKPTSNDKALTEKGKRGVLHTGSGSRSSSDASLESRYSSSKTHTCFPQLLRSRKARCAAHTASTKSSQAAGSSTAGAGCSPAASAAQQQNKPAGSTPAGGGQMSLQGSGSLIPAAFMMLRNSMHTDTDSNPAQGESDESQYEQSACNTASAAGAAGVVATDDGHKLQQGSVTSSDRRNSSNSSSGSKTHDGQDGLGLTLVVSSHSHSTHHDSPRALLLHSGAGSTTSSRASCDSAHTAFASIPSSVYPSGTAKPDSMVSCLSTTSSCISSSSNGGAGAGGVDYRARVAAAAAAASASSGGGSKQEAVTAAGWGVPRSNGGGGNSTSNGGSSSSVPLQQHAQQVQVLLEKVAEQQQQQSVIETATAARVAAAAAQGSGRDLLESPFTAAAVTAGSVEQADTAPLASADAPTPPVQQLQFWHSSGWSFGSHSEQNQRSHMEDRHIAVDLTSNAAFPSAHRAGLFCVYDGNGGHEVAEFLAQHVQAALLAAGAEAITQRPLKALGDAVDSAERQLLLSYAEGNSTAAAAGSTLCAVLLIDDKLHVAHVGDSRAVLARATETKQLTRDHKPGCSIEAKRILSDDPDAHITSDGYLYGELAVARNIGSAHLKRDPSRKALIATAEVATFELRPTDDFVLIASDGLWDAISSNEAVSCARRVLSDNKDAEAACRALVERAQRLESTDNISVITLLLHGRAICMPKSNSMLRRAPTAPPSPAKQPLAA